MKHSVLPALVAVTLVLSVPGRARDGQAERDLRQVRGYERLLQAVVEQVSPSVVALSVEADDGDELGEAVRTGGSGVIVDPAGFVLTNDHVTEGQDFVRVGLLDGRRLEGEVIARDEVGDVAMIRLPVGDLPAAPLGDSDGLRVGDPVLALGNPFGLARDDHVPAVTLGIVSGLHRYQEGTKIYGDAIQIDAAVNPGNSGGPLFDLGGRLVGINGRISIRGPARHNVGVGFSVPIGQIRLVLDDLKAGRDVDRGYLGVRFRVRADGHPGVAVAEVVPGSPAALAGVEAGDRILEVAGRSLDHPVRLQNYLSVLPAGREVTLRIRRAERVLELRVTLGRRQG